MSKTQVIRALQKFLSNPAAWWEKRNWAVALGVVAAALLQVLMELGLSNSTTISNFVYNIIMLFVYFIFYTIP